MKSVTTCTGSGDGALCCHAAYTRGQGSGDIEFKEVVLVRPRDGGSDTSLDRLNLPFRSVNMHYAIILQQINFLLIQVCLLVYYPIGSRKDVNLIQVKGIKRGELGRA